MAVPGGSTLEHLVADPGPLFELVVTSAADGGAGVGDEARSGVDAVGAAYDAGRGRGKYRDDEIRAGPPRRAFDLVEGGQRPVRPKASRSPTARSVYQDCRYARRMTGLEGLLWGLSGGMTEEALKFNSDVREVGRLPWEKRRIGIGWWWLAVALRVGAGGVVTLLAASSNLATSAFVAFMVGFATPQFLERAIAQLPLTQPAPPSPTPKKPDKALEAGE